MKLKRYPDNCYAVVRGNRRGPCGHDRPTARERYKNSGLIAFAGTDKTKGNDRAPLNG
jgi:hypothetical protein